MPRAQLFVIAIALLPGCWAQDAAIYYDPPANTETNPWHRKIIVTDVKLVRLSEIGQIPILGGILQAHANVAHGPVENTIRDAFGAEAVMPLAGGRVEIYGGAGGVFSRVWSDYATPNSWVTQVKYGARFALDQDRHFWLGTTGHYIVNFTGKNRQWNYGSADLTIRFGR